MINEYPKNPWGYKRVFGVQGAKNRRNVYPKNPLPFRVGVEGYFAGKRVTYED